MNNFSKVVVAILVIISALWVKDTFMPNVKISNILDKLHVKDKISIKKPSVFDDELTLSDEGKKILGDEETQQKVEKTVRIYFLKSSNDGTSNIYLVRREVGDTSLTGAIKTLLKGPTSAEKKAGIYSEIPTGTKLIGVIESDDKIIINLNNDFQYGGGTDSVNNRLRQLVKTVITISPDKNLYLYIEGKQVDMLGGDGIMITQPLKDTNYGY